MFLTNLITALQTSFASLKTILTDAEKARAQYYLERAKSNRTFNGFI